MPFEMKTPNILSIYVIHSTGDAIFATPLIISLYKLKRKKKKRTIDFDKGKEANFAFHGMKFKEIFGLFNVESVLQIRI